MADNSFDSKEDLAFAMAKNFGAMLTDGEAYVYLPDSADGNDFLANSQKAGSWESFFMEKINDQNGELSKEGSISYPCMLIFNSGQKKGIKFNLLAGTVIGLQKEFAKRR